MSGEKEDNCFLKKAHYRYKTRMLPTYFTPYEMCAFILSFSFWNFPFSFSPFFPSESLVRYQIWFQTTHNGPNDQCLQKNITDPFLDLWSLPKGPQRAIYMSKTSYFRPQIVPIMAFPPLKWSLDGPNWPDSVQNTPSRWPPQVKRILDPIHAFFEPFGVPEGDFFAFIMAFWGPPEGAQRSKNGSVIHTL